MSDKKNILITGGVGFIGSNLSERLMREGHNVISIDDYSFGKKENEFDNIKYIRNDIESISNIDEPIDICYHLAAKARVIELLSETSSKPGYFRLKSHGVGKYGRVLGELFIEDVEGKQYNINETLINEGHAYKYDGGTKKVFTGK